MTRCGPDGVVYSCWKSPIPLAVLRDFYCHPIDFRGVGLPVAARTSPSRYPSACRSLAVADADCKIMHPAFSWRFQEEAQGAARRVQARIRGRSMADQILEVVAWGIQ
eukprot:860657-Pyramimonas_sp.AAC.1